MGLFDFVKSAGEKLLGLDDDKEKAKAADDAAMAAKARQMRDAQRGARLEKAVRDLGLEVDGLDVKVSGDRVTVTGTAATQADREKAVLVLGNTAGIAQVDDRMDVSAVEPEAVYYTVERGDTLSKIAKEHYGNAMKYPVIFEANKPMLSDPDKIYPGQVLRIPPQEG